MRIQTIENLFIVVSMLLLLVNSSRGAGDNATPKPTIRRCMENERRALLDFKANVFDEFEILSSWGNINNTNDDEEDDCCNWSGIRCSNRTNHVIVLNTPVYYLPYLWARLTGKVSPSLNVLKHLQYLNLGHNGFGCEILDHLGNLTNLRSLDLTDVHLPECNNWLQQIFKLPSLTQLRLSSCNLPDSFLTNSSSSSLNSLAVVDLSYNNFTSPSSYNWLFNFSTNLVFVDLSGNDMFKGSIPEAFGSMVSLKTLRLVGCSLEGMLPESFRMLSRLATLDLADNIFNVTLSEFLHPLAANENNSLQVLYLDNNNLNGSLPDFLTRFLFLREMSISRNKLSGPFLETFWQIYGLVYLDLSYNQITGSFPKKIGQLSQLVHLDLSNNQLTGSFLNTTLFSSLQVLILYNNKLEDTIPEAYLSNLSKLKSLVLSFNSLSLKFSFDWVPPFQLDIIQLQNCNLGPQFPNWLQSQRNFSLLDISVARISDRIPLWFWDLSPRLEYLNMSYNQIKGILPAELSLKFLNIRWIDLSSNHLKGQIPSLPPKVEVLHLSRNMFTGPITFICTTESKKFLSLDLSDNQLSGELPDCWVNFDRFYVLNLANNNLSGEIPTSIGSLSFLQILQLQNNSFIGELPSSMSNYWNLLVLDLSKNKLSGEVPKWIDWSMRYLRILSLRNNKFFEHIPPEICELENVLVLDLSHNNLSGSIPNCINNIPSFLHIGNQFAKIDTQSQRFDDPSHHMITTFIAEALVQWKGQESKYKNTLGLLKLIDLSTNTLTGEIPEEFASFEGLISLNLSSNNLTGNMPPKIGQMKMLEILDLSSNHLSGEIPPSLTSLTFLDVLDLSKNNLTGRIPSSTQLQSFNASVYAGNKDLCGLPLPKCGDALPLPPPVGHGKDENNEEGDDKFAKVGLYVSVVLGLCTGFWGFIGPIMLRSTWRHAYFRLLAKIADWIYMTTTINMTRMQRKIFG